MEHEAFPLQPSIIAKYDTRQATSTVFQHIKSVVSRLVPH